MRRYLFWIVAAGVLIWAIVLRSFDLGVASYWLDEGYSVTIAQAIEEHGYPLLDLGTLIWRSPLYHYGLAGVVLAVGTSELGTRSISVVIGIVTIVIVWYCAQRWFGWPVAAVTLVLASFSTWEITWSRQARMYIVLQALFWLAAVLYERWHHTRQLFWLIPITMLAAILTHQFAWLLLLALPAYSLLDRWHKHPHINIIYWLGVVLALPLGVLIMRYGLHQPVPVNYWEHYLAFLWRDHAVMLILAGIGVVLSFTKRPVITWWLTSLGIVGLGVFSYSITLLHYRYLFFLYPIVLWLAAVTLTWLAQQWRRGAIIGLVVCFGLLLWHGELIVLPQSFWVLESDAPTSAFGYKSFTPQPDFRSAYQAIAAVHPDIIITPYPELTRLYLQRDDTYALYLDVTGAQTTPSNARHTYTGVPFITMTQLQHAATRGAIVLLDKLAERRISPSLRDYIEQHGRIIFSNKINHWSTVTVYHLNP
ncbi:MAG: glycosyltransferase family 39 protein [Candidatus Kerfeldbacteria bacterium]|nr:glycosyltransferase family 39 protein [Candidatus Kerfeldbacteria bacterium]